MIYIVDGAYSVVGNGEIFDIDGKYFQNGCLLDRLYQSTSFFHFDTNVLITTGGGGVADRESTIRYLAMDLYIKFIKIFLIIQILYFIQEIIIVYHV